MPLVNGAAVRETGVPLLEEFCSKPLPKVAQARETWEWWRTNCSPVKSAAKRGGGHHHRGSSARSAPAWGENPGETVATSVPGVHADGAAHQRSARASRLYPNVFERELCVFGELMTQLSRDERDRIPVPEKVQHLGNAADGIGTAEVALQRIARIRLQENRIKAQDFEAYRVRMRYPPLPVSVLVRHPMPLKSA